MGKITLTQEGIEEMADIISQGMSEFPGKIKLILKHLGIDVEWIIFSEFDKLRRENAKFKEEIRDLKKRMKRMEEKEVQ